MKKNDDIGGSKTFDIEEVSLKIGDHLKTEFFKYIEMRI